MTLYAYVFYIPVVRGASHHIFIDRQNMTLIVLCLSMIEKKDLRNIKQRTVESGKRGERNMNDIEDFVYALYSLLLDYALVDAHDLIRST